MTVFVSTFGFTERAVLAPVMRHGIDVGDKIILLIPREFKDERVDNAIQMVKTYMSKFLGEIEVMKKEIPVEDFVTAVSEISAIIEEHVKKGEKVLVNISGGMRILVLETFVAATIIMNKLKYAQIEFARMDIEYGLGYAEIPRVPISLPKLTKGKRLVLSNIPKDGEITIKELVKKLGKNASTISRHLIELRQYGLVEGRRKGRILYVKLTPLGKILVR